MNEKVKKLLLENIGNIVFVIFFIAFIGFMFLPFFEVEALDESIFNLSFANVLSGWTANNVNCPPDGTFIFIFTLILISAILVGISTVFSIKSIKKVSFSCKSWALVSLIIALIMIAISQLYLMGYYVEGGNLGMDEVIGGYEYHPLGFSLVIVSLAGMILSLLRGTLENIKFSVSDMVEIAVLIALAVCLDKVVLFRAPTGGSVNLAGIALLIISVRHGAGKGIIASSVIFGLLTCLIDGYGFQTYPFDYFIAFSGYGVAGLAYNLFNKFVKFSKNERNNNFINILVSLILGAISVFVTRMVGSSISSMVYYGLDLPGALIYNVGYVGFSALISLGCCLVLAKPIEMINHLYPVKRNLKIEEKTVTENSEN